MKTKGLLLGLLFGSMALGGLAQPPKYNVDRSKYPDYDDTFRPDWSVMVDGNKARGLKDEIVLPDHWNNGETMYFPTVFNQAGGSCGPSSRIGYMLTHELNAHRHVSGKEDANRLCPNFVYPFSYNGSSKDQMAIATGVPNIPTYGGFPYSSIYGFEESMVKDGATGDGGWMQGYDRWYAAMKNRLKSTGNFPVSTATPEGMLAVKRWLYNHNGDESFATGGILGLGCAISSSGTASIPNTRANSAAGVVGLQYLTHMGESVDHAITLVGWDDRIEFDLDGNGVCGEESNALNQNEKGAWIFVNSWGSGWGNGGFMYYPYATAGAVNHAVEVNGKTAYSSGDGWWPEIYTIRKNYEPKRVIKLKMTYTQRSSMSLSGGVSNDLSATSPKNRTAFVHFNYQGYPGDDPQPMVPMLGCWADNQLHYEPMEFGYDLTDVCEGYDLNKPMKFFFIVNTKSNAEGTGAVYEASIMDYTLDPNGIETPFVLESDSVDIEGGGKQIIMSVVVNGSGATAPTNLSITESGLAWDAPQGTAHTPVKYYVYKGGEEIAQTTSTEFATSIETGVLYTVKALYDLDGYEVMSTESPAAVKTKASDNVVDNYVGTFSNGGFAIPDVFTSGISTGTIEFRIKPSSITNYNQQIGPNWGQFLVHANSDGSMAWGWNTGSERSSTSRVLTSGAWTHVAIVVDGSTMTFFVNGVQKGTFKSSGYSGFPSTSSFEFGSHGGSNNALYGQIDEVRIWNVARTRTELLAAYQYPLLNPSQYDGLLAYYKMDTVVENGETKFRDCVGGHHASFITSNGTVVPETTDKTGFRTSPPKLRAKINAVENVAVGSPVTFTDASTITAISKAWNIDGKEYSVTSPTITFSTVGEKTAVLTVADAEGATAADTLTFTVGAAEVPTSDFRMTSDHINGSDRLSLISENTVPGCTYLWEMEGADLATATTTNVAVTYSAVGTYDVKLTVTAPDGTKYTTTKQVTVSPSAPKPQYSIYPNIIVKGESAKLTDESSYDPTNASWRFVSDQLKTAAMGLNTSISPSEPGVYNLNYSVMNEYGVSTVSANRVLTVCNADSKNGLFFSGNQKVTAPAPANVTNAWTIEFWFNPAGAIGANTLGINGGTNGYTITSNANGSVTTTVNGETSSSSAGFLVSGWHYYALCYYNGNVYYYRDGVLINNEKMATVTDISSYWNALVLGGETTPMTGTIDELRVWNKRLGVSRLQVYCNSPILDVMSSIDNGNLQLYYDFNQSSGDVVDRSGNNLTGVRTDFGPDGDAWVDTKGVFSLNFGTSQVFDPLGEQIANNKRGKVIAWSDQETSRESSPATNVLDGNVSSFWHSCYSTSTGYPHSVTIERSDLTDIESLVFEYLPARGTNYRASKVTVEQSDDNENWELVEENLDLTDEDQTGAILTSPITKKYIRITFPTGFGSFLALSEIYFYGGLIATDINTVTAGNATIDQNAWYDLQGRRVSKPTTGIYIKGGKKVYVK